MGLTLIGGGGCITFYKLLAPSNFPKKQSRPSTNRGETFVVAWQALSFPGCHCRYSQLPPSSESPHPSHVSPCMQLTAVSCPNASNSHHLFSLYKYPAPFPHSPHPIINLAQWPLIAKPSSLSSSFPSSSSPLPSLSVSTDPTLSAVSSNAGKSAGRPGTRNKGRGDARSGAWRSTRRRGRGKREAVRALSITGERIPSAVSSNVEKNADRADRENKNRGDARSSAGSSTSRREAVRALSITGEKTPSVNSRNAEKNADRANGENKNSGDVRSSAGRSTSRREAVRALSITGEKTPNAVLSNVGKNANRADKENKNSGDARSSVGRSSSRREAVRVLSITCEKTPNGDSRNAEKNAGRADKERKNNGDARNSAERSTSRSEEKFSRVDMIPNKNSSNADNNADNKNAIHKDSKSARAGARSGVGSRRGRGADVGREMRK